MSVKRCQVRSFVAVFAAPGVALDIKDPILTAGESPQEWVSVTRDRCRLWFRLRRSDNEVASLSQSERLTLLLGDDAEWKVHDDITNLANAASICFDSVRATATVYTSIVGLPPVFAYTDGRRTVLASDIYLLASLRDVRLELDPTAVVELGRIGQPVGHRTLFRNTTLLPAASKVVVAPAATIAVDRAWRLPDRNPVDWDQFVQRQAEVFTDSVRRTDVDGSFLALTAGLDTRTVFAVLADQKRLVPSVTMTGTNRSLDARTAARLCRAYGVPHSTVTIDEQFASELPEHVQEAIRLSGGLSGLEQAPEVYLYRQLQGQFTARISGNLGNQVGRGGTEGVGTRSAAMEILAPPFREVRQDTRHWLLDKLAGHNRSSIEFILHEEIPFTSVANYSVGSYFAVQKSPYADRTLIETLAMRPARGSVPSASRVRMQLRDLKHRFLGEPESMSFQRSLLRRIDGFAATCPINFGWRAIGGISPTGLLWGAATFAGMVVRKQRLDDGPLRGVVERLGLATIHDFHRTARWLRESLREFILDTLGSRSVLEAEIFDAAALKKMTDEHFARSKDHYATVAFALDVALAHRTFCSRS